MINRREALKFGFFGAGALALGGIGLSTRSTLMQPAPGPLRALDAQEFSILAAIAARVCPREAPFPSPEALETAAQVDALLASTDPGFTRDLKRLLRLFENGLANFVFGARPQPFTRMAPETQDAVLEAWRTSRLVLRRTGFKALRGLAVAAYFADPATDAAVGYPGPPDVGPQGPLSQVAPAAKLGSAP
jgi:hypothetical protein